MSGDKKIAYEMIEMTVLREFLEDDPKWIVAKILDNTSLEKAYELGVLLMQKSIEIARHSKKDGQLEHAARARRRPRRAGAMTKGEKNDYEAHHV